MPYRNYMVFVADKPGLRLHAATGENQADGIIFIYPLWIFGKASRETAHAQETRWRWCTS